MSYFIGQLKVEMGIAVNNEGTEVEGLRNISNIHYMGSGQSDQDLGSKQMGKQVRWRKNLDTGVTF